MPMGMGMGMGMGMPNGNGYTFGNAPMYYPNYRPPMNPYALEPFGANPYESHGQGRPGGYPSPPREHQQFGPPFASPENRLSPSYRSFNQEPKSNEEDKKSA